MDNNFNKNDVHYSDNNSITKVNYDHKTDNVKKKNYFNDDNIIALVKSSKWFSGIFIFFWLFLFFFVFLDNLSPILYVNNDLAIKTGLSLFILVGFILFALIILLAIKSKSLKKYCSDKRNLFILFLIGIFLFGVTSFIASCITIYKCNEIEKSNFYKSAILNQSNYSSKDISNSTKNTKDSMVIVNICKNTSLTYIVLFLILFIFSILFAAFYIYEALSYHPYDELFPQLWYLALVDIILGYILFVLGIVLMDKLISLKILYFNDVKKTLFFWFFIGLFLAGIPSFIGFFLTIANCNRIKKLYFNNTVIVKKSWKYLSGAFISLSSVVSIIGAGLIGGTYGSYNNYMLLKKMEFIVNRDSLRTSSSLQMTTADYFVTLFTLYNFPNDTTQETYKFVFSNISPEKWNEEIGNLTSHGKAHMNQVLQKQLNAFYDLYPAKDSYEQAMLNSNLSSSELSDIYNLQDSIYYLDCNYDANQDSVIAGSMLLAIGLVALIISATSLGVIIKKEKKQAK